MFYYILNKILIGLFQILFMKELIEQAKNWTNKLRLATETFLDLSSDVKLTNGWGKRELALHLEGWDVEMIKISDHLKEGKAFLWSEFFPKDLDIDDANQEILDRSKELSAKESIEKFKETRKQLLNIYEDIIENYFQDDKRLLDYYSLWGHDVHHLKQAGVDTKEIES